ncbi:amidohydrolase family protein [Pseudomonas oryzihabitans]|uniref:amidohydrolase family protein n=1 Tax=Pseudomonas oryzihabitans TaxID=47885 RepID=UPI002860BA05|nr:amidohydrolase family protein [Pseudomonas psychrotolerans]MDR6676236.1 putative TIM-barrel fold metal-dependent hydrolase [Pseudomonas psychrotolerans]
MNSYTGPIFDAHIHTEFAGAANLQAFKALKSNFDIRASVTDSHTPNCSVQALQALNVGRCAVIAQPEWCLDSLTQQLASGIYVAIKINLGFMPIYAGDSKVEPLYELAYKFGVPILFHTGDTGWHGSRLKYAHPLSLDEVIAEHPQVNFLLVHSGNPWFIDAAVVAAKNNNVWLDLSSIIEGPLNQVSPTMLKRLMIDPIRWMFDYICKPDKFIFGSGWPFVDYPNYVAACAQAIDQQHHQQIFFDNAIRFFKTNEQQ